MHHDESRLSRARKRTSYTFKGIRGCERPYRLVIELPATQLLGWRTLWMCAVSLHLNWTVNFP